MEKRIINPWQWQDERSYVQADGKSSDADMKTQLLLAIQNMEQVIREAGHEPRHIVRLNVYTTCFPGDQQSKKGYYSEFYTKKSLALAGGQSQASGVGERLLLYELNHAATPVGVEVEQVKPAF